MDAAGGRIRRCAAVLGMAVLAGCYTYVPVEQPAPGTDVRVKMPVTSSVGSSSREPEMMAFDGTLVSLGDTLRLQVRTREALGGHREFTTTDTLRVLRSQFEDLEERVLSTTRTAAFTAAVIGGGALLVMAVNGLAGREGDDKPGDVDNPQGAEVPDRPVSGWKLFNIRIPLPWPSG